MSEILAQVKLKEGAKEAINRLVDEGHEIFFITSRGNLKYPNSEMVTINFLRNNSIRYSDIVFNSHDKQADCIQNRIELMIDDSVHHSEAVSRANIKAIVFNSGVNRDIPTELERVDNWQELSKKIEEIARLMEQRKEKNEGSKNPWELTERELIQYRVSLATGEKTTISQNTVVAKRIDEF